MKKATLFYKLFLTGFLFFLVGCSSKPTIKWERFSQETFDKAKKENKLIVLDLKANWCHWCHVMDDSTYSNPKVVKYLSENYISIKVDQDAHPNLANKYRKYGWPATIIFDSEGNEIVKKSGYINPRIFLTVLEKAVKKPIAEEELTKKEGLNNDSNLSLDRKIQRLQTQTINYLDIAKGGYKQGQKYIDSDAFEFVLANLNNTPSKDSMQKWLDNSILGAYQLLDSEWGGVFQYSTHGDWKHVHFEKLLKMQASYIGFFTDYYQLSSSEKSKTAAIQILAYCDRFLKQENGLYGSSQDADLKKGKHSGAYYELSSSERLALGTPSVDENTYTNSNAAMAVAIYKLGLVDDNKEYLQKGQTIISALLQKRKLKNGLFSHDENGKVTALDDNIAVCKTLLSFYNFTGDDLYKIEAISLLQKMTNFKLATGLFANPSSVSSIAPNAIKSENVRIARLYNLAGTIFYRDDFKDVAKVLIEKLYADDLYRKVFIDGAMVLAANEFLSEPTHLVGVDVNENKHLLNATRNFPLFYKFVEVSRIPNLSLEQQELFGNVKQTTVFSCAGNACSMPVTKVSQLKNLIR